MRCPTCGAEVADNAKFCGKCGTIIEQRTKFCGKCGTKLYPGAEFCGKCGARVAGSAGGSTPGGTGGGKGSTPLDGIRGISEWLQSRTRNRNRAKQLLILLLVIGICITSSGLGGKACMSRFSKAAMETEYFEDLIDEIDESANRIAGRYVTKLMVSLIRNDSSGFVSAVTKIFNAAGGMAGASSSEMSFFQMLIAEFAAEYFQEARTELKQEAGRWWPLLQAMAWYKELLTVGLIIVVASLVLLFLLDTRFSELRRLRMMPVLAAGAGWIVLVVIVTILAFSNMISL